jgi:hypothetical protein
MAKQKSAYQAERQEPGEGNNEMQLDPLIDALLEHLPAPGDPFPPDRRKLWMQILELSLKLIYDEQHEGEPPQTEPTTGGRQT